MACKKGQFDVVELMVNDQFKAFSINLNAQHVNGMTPFDLSVHYVRLLDTLGYVVCRHGLKLGFCRTQNQTSLPKVVIDNRRRDQRVRILFKFNSSPSY